MAEQLHRVAAEPLRLVLVGRWFLPAVVAGLVDSRLQGHTVALGQRTICPVFAAAALWRWGIGNSDADPHWIALEGQRGRL